MTLQVSPLASAARLLSGPARFWGRRPLRQQLTLAVWASIIPFSLLGSWLALWRVQHLVRQGAEADMLADAQLINAFLASWERNQLAFLGQISQQPEVRALRPRAGSLAVPADAELLASTMVRLVNREGAIVASSVAQDRQPLSRLEMQRVLRQRPWFQDALQGRSRSGLLPSVGTLRSLQAPGSKFRGCLSASVPVWRGDRRALDDIVGVLWSCVPLTDFNRVSGLERIFTAATSKISRQSPLDPDHGQSRGSNALVIFGQGSVHFIAGNDLSEDYRVRMLDPDHVQQSRWDPILRLAYGSDAPAGSAQGSRSRFIEMQMHGVRYYVALDRSVSGRTLALVMDEATAQRNVTLLFRWFFLLNLMALVVSSLAIKRICAQLSRPVDQAGAALEQISCGAFQTRLPVSAPGGSTDIDRLFLAINRAAARLQAYLAESNSHAVTQAQLREARRIQSDFLIKQLPVNDHEELAASFDSAYEIGADWYDALEVNGITFLVVADVCDKGVPSALFMSVFRSLLRHGLGRAVAAGCSPEAALCSALTATNDYMAENHGETGMFATVFAAAYIPEQGRLIHLVAGHESPLILRADRLESLPVGGPAIGLFSGSLFQVSSTPFHPGDLLFAYSDGLPDARNPAGEAFGHARLEAVLQGFLVGERGAAQVVERFRSEVQQFCSGADPFDDLTLLALLARGPVGAHPATG